MATGEIHEKLVLDDSFSAAFTKFIEMGQDAAGATDLAKRALGNYQSVLSSTDRRLISTRSRLSALEGQQRELIDAGQENSKELQKLAAQSDQLSKSIRSLEQQYQELNEQARSAEKLAKAMENSFRAEEEAGEVLASSLRRLAGGYAAMHGVSRLVDLATETSDLSARLAGLEGQLQNVAGAEDAVWQSAQRARSAYQDTARLVAQVGSMAGSAFHNDLNEVIAFSELVNKSLRVSGASGASAQAALTQLTQGLASGVLRGDELNSVMEQAPFIAQKIAEYMQINIGQLREVASEGAVTADVVRNAMFAASDEIEQRFEDLPTTWADVWTSASNLALRALDPVLSGINWMAGHLEIIGPLVLSVGGTFAVFLTAANAAKIAAGATTICKAAVEFLRLGYLALSGSAEAAAVSQSMFNTAALANPAVWVAGGVMLLVGALYGGVAAYNALTDSSVSATGMIAGSALWLGALVLNGVILPVYNGAATLANFVGNVFNDPISAVKVLFLDMGITVLQIIQNVVSGIEGLVNLIPGVEVSLTSGVDRWVGDLRRQREEIQQASGYTEYMPLLENFSLGSAYQTGYDWGADLAAKLRPGGSGTDFSDFDFSAADYQALDNIENDVARIRKNTDLTKEDLRWMIDAAERRYVNRINLTTAAPVITVNGQNTGNTAADRRSLAEALRDILLEELAGGPSVPNGAVP